MSLFSNNKALYVSSTRCKTGTTKLNSSHLQPCIKCYKYKKEAFTNSTIIDFFFFYTHALLEGLWCAATATEGLLHF